MQEKTIEFDKITVRIKYNKDLTKNDIEESCMRFLKNAMNDKEKKINGNKNTSRTIRKKQILG